jgi:hypothetical protein
MTRISYPPPSRRFAGAAIGVVALVFTGIWFVGVVNGRGRSFGEVVVFLLFGACAYGLNWLYTSGLADEVWDAGDHLIVRFGSTSTRVPIADIESVTESTFTHRGRITLKLWRPAPFGSVVAFVAPRDFLTDLVPLARGRIADSLMERVERRQRTES